MANVIGCFRGLRQILSQSNYFCLLTQGRPLVSTKQHVLHTLRTKTSLCQSSNRFPVWTNSRCLFVNPSNLLGKRFYARKGQLPFEVDTKVPKDTILFSHTNPRFFKMLSIFGIVQLVFWGQLALFSLTSLGIIDSEEGNSLIDKSTFWGKIIMMQAEYKTRIAVLCAMVGTLVAFFTFIYPRRTIRQLFLLQGGKHLRVVTYSHFARSRSFTIPVNNLSVEAARAGKASQVSLKLKGHRFYYLMDKRDGKFHDTKMFDYAVGLRRDLK